MRSDLDTLMAEFRDDTLAAVQETIGNVRGKLEKKLDDTLRKYDAGIQARFGVIETDLLGIRGQLAELEKQNRAL